MKPIAVSAWMMSDRIRWMLRKRWNGSHNKPADSMIDGRSFHVAECRSLEPGSGVWLHSDAGNVDPAPSPDAATGWQAPRVATMLPAELIQGGETIILLLKPSPWSILIRSLFFLSLLAVTVMLILWFQGAGMISIITRRDLALSSFGIGSICLFWYFLDWLGRVYVLTDRRVIRVRGVVRIAVFEAPLRHIQHTHTTFTFQERLFGLGTIGFATSGAAQTQASWRMVAEPLEIHQTVLEALARYR